MDDDDLLTLYAQNWLMKSGYLQNRGAFHGAMQGVQSVQGIEQPVQQSFQQVPVQGFQQGAQEPNKKNKNTFKVTLSQKPPDYFTVEGDFETADPGKYRRVKGLKEPVKHLEDTTKEHSEAPSEAPKDAVASNNHLEQTKKSKGKNIYTDFYSRYTKQNREELKKMEPNERMKHIALKWKQEKNKNLNTINESTAINQSNMSIPAY